MIPVIPVGSKLLANENDDLIAAAIFAFNLSGDELSNPLTLDPRSHNPRAYLSPIC
jgi:hypothetical protein